MAINGRSNPVVDQRRHRETMIRRAAEQINADLSSVGEILRGLEPSLTESYEFLGAGEGKRPMAARLLVARDLRRTIFVAVGHRFAMELLPPTVDLLTGRSAVVPESAELINGARGRKLLRGSAVIAATIRAILTAARAGMYRAWSADEYKAIFSEVRRASSVVSDAARATHQEEFGTRWSDDNADPYLAGDGETRPFRSRTLAFLAHHLSADLDVSLRNSELGQVEHLAVGMTDLYLEFIDAGCPPSERLPVALAYLPLVSGMAALRDEVAERIVFEPHHSPLYRVEKSGRWMVRALKSPLDARVHERPGRCPAVDIITPAGPATALGDFVAALDRITDGRRPAQISVAGVSAADMSAALAAVITDQLVSKHGLTLTAGDTGRTPG
jgi:hypothetical protein